MTAQIFKLETESVREKAMDVLKFLNERAGKRYAPVERNLKFIIDRMEETEEYTVEAMRAVIAMKVREWIDNPEMKKYLRPSTLFNGTNFDKYYGELGPEE